MGARKIITYPILVEYQNAKTPKHTLLIMRHLFTTTLLFCSFAAIRAQVAIGFQVGDPTGLSIQFQSSGGRMTPDLLVAYDFDDYFFANLHGLWFSSLDHTGRFAFYYGPGLFVATRPGWKDYKDRTRLGFSGNFGLRLRFSRVELFAQVIPRLGILPSTGFGAGSGVGLRFLL